MDYAREVARLGLEIGALKLRPNDPFTWASGFRMPIYNDNRMFLFEPQNRELVLDALFEAAGEVKVDRESVIIAGTSTAGIPWGVRVADMIYADFVYVRDKPKDHGLRNQIEGIDSERSLEGRPVILIEDLISTGGSSVKAVQALRDAKGDCRNCLSIFSYGLTEADRLFEALTPQCEVRSVLTYPVLIDVAAKEGYINDAQTRMLEEWRQDPFGWGEKRGFPKAEKK